MGCARKGLEGLDIVLLQLVVNPVITVFFDVVIALEEIEVLVDVGEGRLLGFSFWLPILHLLGFFEPNFERLFRLLGVALCEVVVIEILFWVFLVLWVHDDGLAFVVPLIFKKFRKIFPKILKKIEEKVGKNGAEVA